MKRVLAAIIAAAPGAAYAQDFAPTMVAEAPSVDLMDGGAIVWTDQPKRASDEKPAATVSSKAKAPGAPMQKPALQSVAAKPTPQPEHDPLGSIFNSPVLAPEPSPSPSPLQQKTAAGPGPAVAPNPLIGRSATSTPSSSKKVVRSATPPPFDPLAGVDNPPMSSKERRGVAYGKEWRGNRDKPARGADGSIVYMFGATLPTIVCAPLYVCDLVLQPGETVKTINVGDTVRWQITAAEQGVGEALITHVIIKPTDIGLITNMVITTDRRAYVIKMLSRADDWMPIVAFDYPDASRVSWSVYRAQRAAEQEARDVEKAAIQEPTGPIDDNYRLSGDRPRWRPQRVYTDGVKTFVEFHGDVANGDLPALVTTAEDPSFLQLESLFNGPQRQLVNYRKDGNRFVVDKVLDKAALVMGVGSQATVVEIEHVGRYR